MGDVLNKRSENRFNCFVPVEGKEGSVFDLTKTVDVSRHGVGLISTQKVDVNQKIAVELVLKPNTDPVMVVGVVKWVRKVESAEQYRVGLAFLDIISGSGSRLDKFFSGKHWEKSL